MAALSSILLDLETWGHLIPTSWACLHLAGDHGGHVHPATAGGVGGCSAHRTDSPRAEAGSQQAPGSRPHEPEMPHQLVQEHGRP